MNIFTFFFMTTAVVTAAPHAARTSEKHQQKNGHTTQHEGHQKSKDEANFLLRDIIDDVKHLKKNLTEKTLQKNVQHAFMNEQCNDETLCQARKVLSAYNASDLRLKSERQWRLPRKLLAYSKNCTDPDKLDNVPLLQLLDDILSCAQKKYAKSS